MTAHGSGDFIDGLRPKVLGGDQVPDAKLFASMDAMCPVKTFGTVVGPRQKPGHVTHSDMAASLCNVQEIPQWI